MRRRTDCSLRSPRRRDRHGHRHQRGRPMSRPPSALAGLRILKLPDVSGSPHRTAVRGLRAEAVSVERPGSSPLRKLPGFPIWFCGKKSIELGLGNGAGAWCAREPASASDVIVDIFRLGAAAPPLRRRRSGQPRGRLPVGHRIRPTGPYAQPQGYEALVFARVGVLAAIVEQERPVGCCPRSTCRARSSARRAGSCRRRASHVRRDPAVGHGSPVVPLGGNARRGLPARPAHRGDPPRAGPRRAVIADLVGRDIVTM